MHWPALVCVYRLRTDRIKAFSCAPSSCGLLCADSGAMFAKYNTTLRSCLEVDGKPVAFFVAKHAELCKGNNYTTTIHVISSGILKLSKIERAGKVYRGLSGLKLPDEMIKANTEGVRGGVECSFLSSTRDRRVATAYAAGASAGIILEINMGIVDRGGDLSWISQCAPWHLCHDG